MGAGAKSWETRRANAAERAIAAERAKYDSPGKRDVYDLVIGLARLSDCETYLGFFGGAGDADRSVAAGLTVTMAETNPRLHGLLAYHAAKLGYVAFPGPAHLAPGDFDFIFADFCGNASQKTLEALQPLAKKAKKWLAVTLSPDHQTNEALSGSVATFTTSAWLIGVTGMSLEYLGRYGRNDKNQWMWIALLRPVGPKTMRLIDPVVIERNVSARGYWASELFMKANGSGRARTDGRTAIYNALVPHRYPVPTPEKLARRAAYRATPEQREKTRIRNEKYNLAHRARLTEDAKRRRELIRAGEWPPTPDRSLSTARKYRERQQAA